MSKAPVYVEMVAIDLLAEGSEHASDDERRRAGRMMAEAAARWLVIRSVVRRELSRWLHVAPAEVVIEVTPGGKPRVRGGEFSISHSGSHLVIAWSRQPVGVDVEARLPGEPDRLAARFFSAPDAALVDGAETFRLQWVAKEAALKVLGVGLAGQLERAVCRWREGEVVGVDCGEVSYETHAFRLADGTPGAVAWQAGPMVAVRWRD